MWTQAEVSMPKWLCYAIWNSSHSGRRRGETLITTPWWILYACVCVWEFITASSTLVTFPSAVPLRLATRFPPSIRRPASHVLRERSCVNVTKIRHGGSVCPSVYPSLWLSSSATSPKMHRTWQQMYTLLPRTLRYKYIWDIKGLVHLGSTNALLSSTMICFRWIKEAFQGLSLHDFKTNRHFCCCFCRKAPRKYKCECKFNKFPILAANESPAECHTEVSLITPGKVTKRGNRSDRKWMSSVSDATQCQYILNIVFIMPTWHIAILSWLKQMK